MQDARLKNINDLLNNHEKSSYNKANAINSAMQNDVKDPLVLQEPSQPSPNEAVAEQQLPNSIYRLGHSDLFACKNCKVKGDKPFTVKHPQYCRGARVSQTKQIGGEARAK